MKNKDKFEQACRDYGMIPVYRVKTPLAEFLVADSGEPIMVPDEETGEMVRSYVTMWGIGRSQLEFGRKVYTPPTLQNARIQHRINLAIQDAHEFCKTGRTAGLYHA